MIGSTTTTTRVKFAFGQFRPSLEEEDNKIIHQILNLNTGPTKEIARSHKPCRAVISKQKDFYKECIACVTNTSR